MMNLRNLKARRNRSIARLLVIVVMASALVMLPMALPGVERTAEASCFENGDFCDFVNSYTIYNNGNGTYDIVFSLKNDINGSCGYGSADFWSIDCGSGTNLSSYRTVIQVTPCYSQFTVYIKVKGYDTNGNSLKTGASPSPFGFDVTNLTGYRQSYTCTCSFGSIECNIP